MTIVQRLSEINNLPTLPEIILRIEMLIMSEEGNATPLSRIIEEDPSLTAKILKVANSSFYRTSEKKISSISRAITRIGFNEIGHIALAVNFVQQFSHKSNVLDYRDFWKHALTAAHLCSMIAQENACGKFIQTDRHTLFLAGLLHDIGILIYDQFFHMEFEEIINTALDKETSYLDAELQVAPKELHGKIGAALLERWKIDSNVVAAVRFHHVPEKAADLYRMYVLVTHAVEYYLCNHALGSFEGTVNEMPFDINTELNVTHEHMIELFQKANDEVENSNLVQAFETNNDNFRLKAI